MIKRRQRHPPRLARISAAGRDDALWADDRRGPRPCRRGPPARRDDHGPRDLHADASCRPRSSLKARVRRRARSSAAGQANCAFHYRPRRLCLGAAVVVLLVEAHRSIGQRQLAAFLPFIALGMPARLLRFADVRTASPYYRLALAGGGLVMVSLGWAAGWHAAAMGLAFGARDWIAYARCPLVAARRQPIQAADQRAARFAEVARNSAIIGRGC